MIINPSGKLSLPPAVLKFIILPVLDRIDILTIRHQPECGLIDLDQHSLICCYVICARFSGLCNQIAAGDRGKRRLNQKSQQINRNKIHDE
jgi:hypothetical protein